MPGFMADFEGDLAQPVATARSAGAAATSGWDPSTAYTAAGTAFTLNSGGYGYRSTSSGIIRGAAPGRGKVYAEAICAFARNTYGPGLVNSAANGAQFVGYDINGISYSYDGNIYFNSQSLFVGSTYVMGAVVGIAYDQGAGRAYFSLDGIWQNAANPTQGAGGFAVPSGALFLAGNASNGGFLINTGQMPLPNKPAGFSAWG